MTPSAKNKSDVLKEAEATVEKTGLKRYPAYPAYKPSGVEWLEDVPEHWQVRRLKQVSIPQFSNVDKHTKEGELFVRLCNYTDVYYNEHIVDLSISCRTYFTAVSCQRLFKIYKSHLKALLS